MNLNNSTSVLDYAFQNLSAEEILESDILADIALLLTKRRAELKLSQRDFAIKLNISQSLLSRFETGQHNFTIKSLAKVFTSAEMKFAIQATPFEKITDLHTDLQNIWNTEGDILRLMKETVFSAEEAS